MLASWTHGRARRVPVRRLTLETLETRLAPAVGTSFVNDNWFIVNDIGTAGLSAGDIVRNDNDTTNPGSITAVFGTDGFNSISDAITNTVAGGTVNVLEGSYTANVVINKNLTLRSIGGAELTTITGTGNTALGTVLITNNTTAVTLGGTDAGFTLIGIDNASPGIESAAVYFQGNHSGALIRGNNIVANGDSGLITEFGVTISNFVIDGNEFSGQSFIGTPAGEGSGQQFTLANVPRQLVVMGGGSGGGNTSNITFTNNLITGTAGGINSAGNEQGNNLVTIDSNGATITGNTFAGTTTRFGIAYRGRGPNTTIADNTFDSSNMTATTGQVFIQNTGETLDEVFAANTFDRSVFVPGGSTGTIGVDLQTAINAAPDGTTLNVQGTFPGNVNVNKEITLVGDFTVTGTFTVSDPDAVVAGKVSSAGLNLVAGSTFVVNLSSPTNFDTSVVTGSVQINGVGLVVNVTFTPLAGSSFTIIDNDGTDAIGGTFAGLVEGAAVAGTPFFISYVGGDGNDVILFTPPPPPEPIEPPAPRLAVSSIGGQVIVMDPTTGATLFALAPFPGYLGTVRLATGDVNGDGVEDILVVNSIGQGNVKVFDGQTGAILRSFLVFEGYLGGVNIASGDLNGDGQADIIVATNGGASGHVQAFSGANTSILASFLAYGADYTGAVLIAAGDVDGDQSDDIVTLASAFGHIKVFSGANLSLLASFIDAASIGAASIASADVSGDGQAELFLGGSTGTLTVLDPRTQALVQTLTPFPGYTGALGVLATELAGDSLTELAVATLQGAGHTRLLDDSFESVDDLFAFGLGFLAGVSIG